MKKYWISSIVLHGVMIGVMLVVWQPREIKTLQTSMVQSFFYQKTPFIRDPISSLRRPAINPRDDVVKKFERSSMSRKLLNGRINYPTLSPKDKNNNDPLIKILHDAIAKVQHYPESALALNQSGSVMLGFKVHPDGQLSDIQLEQSSGYDRLDQAALTAARSIVTIHEAKQYLTEAHHYSIEVQFENG